MIGQIILFRIENVAYVETSYWEENDYRSQYTYMLSI